MDLSCVSFDEVSQSQTLMSVINEPLKRLLICAEWERDLGKAEVIKVFSSEPGTIS